MKTSIQIGKVMGIPIKIHISFLLVLVLFPYVFANDAEFGFADVASAQLRYALALTLTISELLRLMFEKKHLGYPVVDQFTGKIIGIVTFTDIRSVPMSEHGNVLVRDVMAKNVIFIPEDADAMDALKIMSTENVGQLLVQDKGSITGIVSRTDLTRSIEVLGYRER